MMVLLKYIGGGGMKQKWVEWLENGEVEFTRTEKRKRTSYEMISVWKKISEVIIIKGFKECGYIE